MVSRIFIDWLRRREILPSIEILEYDSVIVEKDQAAADNSIAAESCFIKRFELCDILARKRLRP